MPTIRFDWDKWSRSQWFGFPKNRMWSKLRDGDNDVNGEPTMEFDIDEPNVNSTSPVVGEVARDHRFTGYKSDVYFDADDDVASAEWADHYSTKMDEAVDSDGAPL